MNENNIKIKYLFFLENTNTKQSFIDANSENLEKIKKGINRKIAIIIGIIIVGLLGLYIVKKIEEV